MQERGIISTRQVIWLLFSIITSFTALQIPGLLILQAGRDAWLSVLLAWLLDVLLALVYAYMGIRFPGENFVQYSITILGKYLGRIVGIMFPLFFLMVCATLQYSLCMFIVNAIMPETPISVVLCLFYIVIGYSARKGIEAIARTCEILSPIYLVSFAILFLLLSPAVKLSQLKPQFEAGIYPFLSTAPLVLTFFGICIMMGMYIPVCNRPENGFLTKFTSVTLGALVICTLLILCVNIFGVEQSKHMVNPGFQLASTIHIGDFLERLEMIWLAIALGAGIATSVNLIWAFSLGISQITGLADYKPLVYPATLLSLVLSLTSFKSVTAALNFGLYTYPIIGIFVESGLEIMLFIMALLLGKSGRVN